MIGPTPEERARALYSWDARVRVLEALDAARRDADTWEKRYAEMLAQRDAALQAAARARAEVCEQLATAAEKWRFGEDGHLWQVHEKLDFARWLRKRAEETPAAPAEPAACGRGCTTWCMTGDACPLDAGPAPAAGAGDDLDAHLAEQMADPAFAAAYRARQAAGAGDGKQDALVGYQRQCDITLPHGDFCTLVLNHKAPCSGKDLPTPIGECYWCWTAPRYPLDARAQHHAALHRAKDADSGETSQCCEERRTGCKAPAHLCCDDCPDAEG